MWRRRRVTGWIPPAAGAAPPAPPPGHAAPGSELSTKFREFFTTNAFLRNNRESMETHGHYYTKQAFKYGKST